MQHRASLQKHVTAPLCHSTLEEPFVGANSHSSKHFPPTQPLKMIDNVTFGAEEVVLFVVRLISDDFYRVLRVMLPRPLPTGKCCAHQRSLRDARITDSDLRRVSCHGAVIHVFLRTVSADSRALYAKWATELVTCRISVHPGTPPRGQSQSR